jgi:hypothetical protein
MSDGNNTLRNDTKITCGMKGCDILFSVSNISRHMRFHHKEVEKVSGFTWKQIVDQWNRENLEGNTPSK